MKDKATNLIHEIILDTIRNKCLYFQVSIELIFSIFLHLGIRKVAIPPSALKSHSFIVSRKSNYLINKRENSYHIQSNYTP